ncbi:hypothetical protein [Sphingomonas sp.]|uniref:hypothetical protein n=1 Tax=Sphingomonas sp. TaxID=28214 RepID=UPI002ED85868
MCSALALACVLAGFAPAAAQPATLQVDAQPPESLPAVDDADYQWIDDADALLDAIGDSPPDFTFAYDGADIWGWRTGTGHEIYGEPSGGAIRYYYFEPGSREPFLVQDADFAFGYGPGGQLIVVYDADGRLLSRSEGDREAALADQLYRRGRAIHASAQNDRGWEPVDAGYWAQQIPVIVDLRLRWSEGRERHQGWKRWHGRSGAGKWRRPLAAERQRRWSAGDRFRRWQREGFRGPPPRWGEGGTHETARPQRPDRPGWSQPRPSATGTPPMTNPVPGTEQPQRPSGPGWGRQRPPAGGERTRPPRFEAPPVMPRRTAQQPGAAPPPAASGRPQRPHWRRDGSPRPDRPSFTRPPGFAPAERPHSAPRPQPVERPQFAPRPAPPARVAPPPPPPPPPPRIQERMIEHPQ